MHSFLLCFYKTFRYLSRAFILRGIKNSLKIYFRNRSHFEWSIPFYSLSVAGVECRGSFLDDTHANDPFLMHVVLEETKEEIQVQFYM